MSVEHTPSYRKLFPSPQLEARQTKGMALATAQVTGDVSGGSLTVAHKFPTEVKESVQLVTVVAHCFTAVAADVTIDGHFFFTPGNSIYSSQPEYWTESVSFVVESGALAGGKGWGVPQFICQLQTDEGISEPIVGFRCNNPGADITARLSVRYLVYQGNVNSFVPFGTQNYPITAS